MENRFCRRAARYAMMVLIVLAVSMMMSIASAETAFADGEELPYPVYDNAEQAKEASRDTHETVLYYIPEVVVYFEEPEYYNAGNCGDNVKYRIYGRVSWEQWHDEDTGEYSWEYDDCSRGFAMIYGTGPTYDYKIQETINWSGVQEVLVQEGVTGIGKCFFDKENGNSISKVTLPESLESIGNSAFRDSTGLKEIYIPDGVKYIGKYAFSGCTRIEKLGLPNGLKTIEESSFYGLEKMKTLIIPDSVTEIKDSAFEFCYKLSNIRWGKGLKKIGEYAFVDCAITELDIPDHVTSIGESSFAVCKKLKKIRLSKNLKKIPAEAFERCKKLTKISIPASSKITVIGDGAFESCESLKAITLPKGVKMIKDDALHNCPKLRTIKFLGKKPFKFQSYCVFTTEYMFSERITKKITIKCPNMSKANKAKFRKYLKKVEIHFFGKVK